MQKNINKIKKKKKKTNRLVRSNQRHWRCAWRRRYEQTLLLLFLPLLHNSLLFRLLLLLHFLSFHSRTRLEARRKLDRKLGRPGFSDCCHVANRLKAQRYGESKELEQCVLSKVLYGATAREQRAEVRGARTFWKKKDDF